ncbi:MAG: transposase [Bacteroidales bacterium]|nr:transposase [Bacteroidales bacterium]
MRYNSNIHHRRSIRLKGYDYSQAGLYFVTICVRNREHLFGEIQNWEMVLNGYGEIVARCWSEIPKHYPNTILHEFVVMPNHVHGIIQIIEPVGAQNFVPLHIPKQNTFQKIIPRSIGSIIRGFKIGVTKQLNQFECFGVIWQRNYYEHIILTNRSYQYIANYIINNPKNWEKDKFFVSL